MLTAIPAAVAGNKTRVWRSMNDEGKNPRNEKLWNEMSASFHFYYWAEKQIVDLLPFVLIHILMEKQ